MPEFTFPLAEELDVKLLLILLFELEMLEMLILIFLSSTLIVL